MRTFTITDGLLQPATFIASPNFNARPQALGKPDISGIVIHNISLPPCQFGKHDSHGVHYVAAFFQNKLNPADHPYFATIYQMQVSAHLFVTRDGHVMQFVNFHDRAWHAGVSSYLGRQQCNDFTIGIELEGSDDIAYTDEQYAALSGVVSAIYQAYPQTKKHLMGHSDIAPVRKTDPGKAFDWPRFRRQLHHQYTQQTAQQTTQTQHAAASKTAYTTQDTL